MKNYWLEKANTLKETNGVISENRRLKAYWSMDAYQDVCAFYRMNAEEQFVKEICEELLKDIDREIKKARSYDRAQKTFIDLGWKRPTRS